MRTHNMAFKISFRKVLALLPETFKQCHCKVCFQICLRLDRRRWLQEAKVLFMWPSESTSGWGCGPWSKEVGAEVSRCWSRGWWAEDWASTYTIKASKAEYTRLSMRMISPASWICLLNRSFQVDNADESHWNVKQHDYMIGNARGEFCFLHCQTKSTFELLAASPIQQARKASTFIHTDGWYSLATG